MPLDRFTTDRPVLVTGGLGFIGGHLVDGLLAAGVNDIRVFDNHRRAVTNAQDWPVDKVALIRGDVRDRTELQKAMQGCEVVYHLAAQSNVLGAISDPDYSFSTNVGGTLNVLIAAKDVGVRRIVFTSSREVYGDQDQIPIPESAPLRPKNLYGASKAAGEMYCRALGDRDLEVVVTRLANVYGPRDRDRVIPIFLECALNGAPLTVYGGDQVIDFVWIDTVIETLLAVGFTADASEPVNIGSGVGTTVLELARRILDLVPSNSQCVRLPVRNVEVSRFVADISRAKSVLGMPSPDEPLVYLPQLVDRTREEAILIG
jgi:UDP-glucose 4-epimerase